MWHSLDAIRDGSVVSVPAPRGSWEETPPPPRHSCKGGDALPPMCYLPCCCLELVDMVTGGPCSRVTCPLPGLSAL